MTRGTKIWNPEKGVGILTGAPKSIQSGDIHKKRLIQQTLFDQDKRTAFISNRMPTVRGVEVTLTIILSSDLEARRRARDWRDRPWLIGANIPWDTLIPWFDVNDGWGAVETEVQSPEPSESFEIPFRDQYYFRVFLLESIEECCSEYARDNLQEQMRSESWRRAYLENLPGHWQFRRSWPESGTIELTEWTILFRRIVLLGEVGWSVPCALTCADQLRHTTIHREQLPIDHMISAIQVIRLLNY